MKWGITVLRNSAGVPVTGAKGKLEVLKSHYQHLDAMYSVDTAFDDSWKEEVDKKVCDLPADCAENAFDREIDLEEIALC